MKFLISFGIVLLSLTGLPTASLFAQSEDSFFEEDSFDTFQEDDAFTDDIDFNELDFDQQEEFDEEEQADEEGTGFEDGEQQDDYVDEDILPDNTQELLNQALRARQAFLQQEKANFAPNILYGVGTGLIIGGWFALLTANTSRDTLRSIGLGIVLGGVMGSIIGGRSVLTPDAPRPQETEPQANLFQQTRGLTLAYQWKF